MGRMLAEELAEKGGASILLCVLDGLGDIPVPALGGRTPLEAARTPNLDSLAAEGALGQHIPVAPGITPGSGPAHLALFGYDPVEHFVGRGILSALGIGFPVRHGDLAIRANFCTIGPGGEITDRRAGRIPTEKNRELAAKLSAIAVKDVEVFVETEKEHRACVVIRGEGLSEKVSDTDPGHTGVPPLEPRALEPGAERTAAVLAEFLREARSVLAGESQANGILLRGYAAYTALPAMSERFRVNAAAAALYPMYRGVASLVGMTVLECGSQQEQVHAARRALETGFDFVFLHHKPTDSSGEDGDPSAKIAAVEEFDAMLPGLASSGFGVVCVTGDHSTPCAMKLHSWHPVPLLVHGGPQRTGISSAFSERQACSGAIGTIRAVDLMPILLASAGRLAKYGA